jgi:hypothetical protein
MLALVGFNGGIDDSDLGSSVELYNIAEDAVALFDDIESALDNEIANRLVYLTRSRNST